MGRIFYSFFSDINDNCKRIDHLVSKESVARKKALKYRADQLKHDYGCVTASLNALTSRLTNKWRIAAEREELLHQRFRPNETTVNFGDQELLINDKIKQSNRGVDELISHGTAVLDSLRIQGANLGSIKQKIFDIGQTVCFWGSILRRSFIARSI